MPAFLLKSCILLSFPIELCPILLEGDIRLSHFQQHASIDMDYNEMWYTH